MHIILAAVLATVASGFSIQLCIRRATLSHLTSTFSVPFPHQFSNPPSFGYGIQGIYSQQSQLSIQSQTLSESTSSFRVQLIIKTTNNVLYTNEFVDVVFIWVCCQYVEIGMATLDTTSATVSYRNQHRYNYRTSYSLTVSTLSIPCLYTLGTLDSFGFTITLTQYPTQPGIKKILMYVVVEKIFISEQIYIIFDVINQVRRNFVAKLGIQSYVQANDQNSFQTITELSFPGPTISLPKLIIYKFLDYLSKPCLKIGFYSTNTPITTLRSVFTSFNPSFQGCPDKKFLSYIVPYTTLPRSCLPCHSSCLTCTSSQQDSTYTDFRFCTSCVDEQYVQPYLNYKYGYCKCLKGIETDSEGNCLPCQFNCLEFRVELMESAKKAIFLVIFTDGNLELLVEFQNNLVVYMNEEQIDYNFTNTSPGAYIISLRSQNLTKCLNECELKFKFLNPQLIKSKHRYLIRQSRTLTLRNFYIAADRLPQAFNKAMMVSSYLIATASSTGQASFIKMLFELEQVIEAHKYLNLELPVVFKEFIQSLSVFRFMDFTTLIQYDVNQLFRSLSGSQLDCKGNYKIVYYENGANFYKNMVPVFVSFFIILIINILIYLVLRIIPLEFTRRFAEKIRIRWLITLSQMIQTLILPISLFFTFQSNYTLLNPNYLWIYILSSIFCFLIFIYPFLIFALAIKQPNKMTHIELQIIQDLLQDCKLSSKYTYLFYWYGYLKKFVIGLVLANQITGYMQNLLLLLLNIMHMFIILGIVSTKAFKSTGKILFRTLILLCMIILEALIADYNIHKTRDIDAKIKIGSACLYLALSATVMGILELGFKLFQIITQQISSQKIENPRKNDIIIKCELGLKNPAIADAQSDDEEWQQNTNSKVKQIEYQETIEHTGTSRKLKDIRKRNKDKNKNNNKEVKKDGDDEIWSRFSELENNKKTIQVGSESSQIVFISDQVIEEPQIEKVVPTRQKKNRPPIPLSTMDRDRTASTKVQTKPQPSMTNTVQTQAHTRRKENKIKKTIESAPRNNKIMRVNDKRNKKYKFENLSEMSQIVPIE